jgi:hypothetical protein
MEFYEVEWVDHHGRQCTAIIPYSEIVAFKIFKHETFEIYTPITKTGGYDYMSKNGLEGATEYLKWKAFLNRNI